MSGYFYDVNEVRKDAIPPDGINKMGYEADDYETNTYWHEYTEEELSEKANFDNWNTFKETAPERITDAELGVAELGVISSDNSISIEELSLAIAELGVIVTGE